MTRHGTGDPSGNGTGGLAVPDALTSLLETERLLGEEVAQAEETSRTLAESARAAVTRMESAFEAELAESLRALEAVEETTTQSAIAAAASEARARIRGLTAVPDEFVTLLARDVLRDFLGVATIGAEREP